MADRADRRRAGARAGGAAYPRAGVPPRPATDPSEIVAFAGTHVTSELHEVMVGLATKRRRVLPRAGIVSLDHVAAMTDEQLLAIDGIGHGTVARLRDAIAERDPDDGATLARKVYELLQAGLPQLVEEDPMRLVLAEALPSLAAALGSHQATACDRRSWPRGASARCRT